MGDDASGGLVCESFGDRLFVLGGKRLVVRGA